VAYVLLVGDQSVQLCVDVLFEEGGTDLFGDFGDLQDGDGLDLHLRVLEQLLVNHQKLVSFL